jgi:hypothetical protein
MAIIDLAKSFEAAKAEESDKDKKFAVSQYV